MASPPEQVYIESRDKDETFGSDPTMRAQTVVFKDENRQWTYYKPEHEAVDLVPGLELEVWKNHEKGKITVAASRSARPQGESQPESRPESQSDSRGGSQQQLQPNDPTRESIERQTAWKGVAEILAHQGYSKDTFAQDVKFMVDAAAEAIQSENPDEKIPF